MGVSLDIEARSSLARTDSPSSDAEIEENMAFKVDNENERRPSTDSQDETAQLLSPAVPEPTEAPQTEVTKPWVLVTVVGLVVVFLADLGAFLVQAPLTRFYEAISCNKYYLSHDPSVIIPGVPIPEYLCKVNDVQDTVATIFGWQNVWDALPSMILAVPYGALADKWGRKPVAILSLFGAVLGQFWILFVCYMQFPLWMVWFSSAFTLIGGGGVVAASILFTVVADVVPEAIRTSVFLWMHAAVLVAELIAPVISTPTMKRSIWLPLIIGTAVQVSGLICVMFVPETLHHRTPTRPNTPGSQDDEGGEGQGNASARFPKKDGGSFVSKQYHRIKESVQFLFEDRNIFFMVMAFAFSNLGYQAMALLLQYVSKRYGWSLADANLLGSVRAAISLAVFLVAIPAVMAFMQNRLRMDTDTANLAVTKYSGLLMVVGFVGIGLAPNAIIMIFGLIIYVLGGGFAGPARSVTITLIGGAESEHIAQLFATIGVVAAMGAIVSGPLVPLFWHWGQSIGGTMLGLPFMGAGALMAVSTLVVFLVRLPKIETQDEDRRTSISG